MNTPTIRDVAKLAGVSVSTVSNVLNDKITVGEEKYKAVLSAMQTLNYKPNIMARNLRNNKTRFVGVIVPTLSGVYRDIYHGFANSLGDEYYIFLKVTNGYESIEYTALRELVDLGVCGILLVSCFETIDPIEHFFEMGIPIVFVNRCFEEYEHVSVIFDNAGLVSKVFSRLFASGVMANEVVLITGKSEFSSERDCFIGARDAIDQYYGEKEPINWIKVSLDEVSAFGEVFDYFHAREFHHIKAIVVSDDCVLNGLIEVLRINGLRNTTVYALAGERWNVKSQSDQVHFLSRKAVTCGRKGAEKLNKLITEPLFYDGIQEVISTELINEYAVQFVNNDNEGLRILLTTTPIASAIQKLATEYSNISGTRIACEMHECQISLYDELLSNKKGNYDLFMMDLPWLDTFVREGSLYDVSSLIDIDQDYYNSFIDGLWDKITRADRAIFGIPLAKMTQVMLFRKDYFEDKNIQRMYFLKYGIPLELPKNWQEFNLVSKFFTRNFNRESPTEYGTCLLGKAPTGLIQEFLPRQWSQNGKIIDGGKVVIDSSENIRALDNLRDAVDYSVPGIEDTMENEQIMSFCLERTAIINSFDGHLHSMFDSRYRKIANCTGFASIPGSHSLLGMWLLSINKKSNNPELAFDFIRWLTSDPISLKCSLLGGFVPKKVVSNSESLVSNYPWVAKVSRYIHKEREREALYTVSGKKIHNSKVDEILAKYINKALFEGIMSKKALYGAKIELQEFLNTS